MGCTQTHTFSRIGLLQGAEVGDFIITKKNTNPIDGTEDIEPRNQELTIF